MKYDDDTVSAVPPEEVLKLSGGGIVRSCDLHMTIPSQVIGTWRIY